MDNTKKREWRIARSALRLLLHYPHLTAGVEQFKRVPFRGTDYIYNERAANVIATIRNAGGKGPLIRYRPSSYYADILTDHARALGPHAVALPSHNLSRQDRRMRRFIQRIRSHSRSEMIERLRRDMNRNHMFDGATMDRKALRVRSRDIQRLSIMLNGMAEPHSGPDDLRLYQLRDPNYSVWYQDDGSFQIRIFRIRDENTGTTWHLDGPIMNTNEVTAGWIERFMQTYVPQPQEQRPTQARDAFGRFTSGVYEPSVQGGLAVTMQSSDALNIEGLRSTMNSLTEVNTNYAPQNVTYISSFDNTEPEGSEDPRL